MIQEKNSFHMPELRLRTFLPGLILFEKPLCLASQLVTTLLELTQAERFKTQVILPTSRLANRISAQACQRVGAWYEPRFFTFDSFVDFHFNLTPVSGGLPAAADDVETSLALGHLIRHGNYRHINQSHISELKQLFNEFEDWRLGIHGFERFRAVLSENTFRSDEAIANLYERVDETETLYVRLEEALASECKVLARRRQVLKADLLTAAIEQGQTAGNDRILMAGITSIMPWSHPMLTAIAKHWPLQVWAPMPTTISGSPLADRDPVRVLMSALSFQDEQVTTLPDAYVLTTGTAQITINQATGVFEETAAALNLVNKAIAAGILPAEIGVLVTNDNEYGRPLRALLQQLPTIEFNAAITKSFSTCQTGSWLAALRQLLQRGEDAPALTSFLTHPVTLNKIRLGLPNKQKHQAVLREEVIRDLCQAGVEQGLAATCAGIRLKNPNLADGITCVNNALAEFLIPDYEASIADWHRHLADLLDKFAPIDQEDPTRPGLKHSVQKGLDSFLTSISQSVIRQEKINAGIFFELVAEHLLSSDIRDTGEQMRGVQILSVEEARFIPFRLLIILGCNEGSFPRALPKDYLFDNFLKTKIGLPGWQAVEAIEDLTFQLLKARAPNLQLFYTENPADGRKIRSRFIDEIKQASKPMLITVDGAAALRPYIKEPFTISAGKDRGLRVEEAGKFGGDRAALLSRLSATSVESLIKCPYRFLLRQLGVRELEIPEEDDRRKDGDWLHGVLEAFFTGSWGEKKIAAPIDTNVGPEAFLSYAIRRLETLTDAICPPQLVGTESWVQARTIGWPAFARHIASIYQEQGLSRIGYGKRELQYKTRIPLVGPGDGDAFSPVLSGKIDSIDFPVAGIQLITDYKRSGVPKKSDVLSGNSPQLTLYAAALSELTKNKRNTSADGTIGSNEQGEETTYPETDLNTAIIGYWSILKGEFIGVAAGNDVRTQADQLGLMSIKSKGDLNEVYLNLQQVVGRRKKELLASPSIIPDPRDCSFCGFSGICRKDDPEFVSIFVDAPPADTPAPGPEESV